MRCRDWCCLTLQGQLSKVKCEQLQADEIKRDTHALLTHELLTLMHTNPMKSTGARRCARYHLDTRRTQMDLRLVKVLITSPASVNHECNCKLIQ